MTNQTIIQVPPNVAEPIVLKRFLLRLVEELDIVLGNRGASTDEQYVAQKELIEASNSLVERSTELREQLEAATQLLADVTRDELDDVDAQLAALDSLTSELLRYTYYRSVMARFSGATTNGPVSDVFSDNVETITRVAPGVYHLVLTRPYYGDVADDIKFLDRTQFHTAYKITDNTVSDVFQINVTTTGIDTVVMSIFSVKADVIVSPTDDLILTPYDPIAPDFVDISGLYTRLIGDIT